MKSPIPKQENKYLPFKAKHRAAIRRTKIGASITTIALLAGAAITTQFHNREPFDTIVDAVYAHNTKDAPTVEMVVTEGDTLWSMAAMLEIESARRDVYEHQFRKANNIPDDKQIQFKPGERYIFPNPHDAL